MKQLFVWLIGFVTLIGGSLVNNNTWIGTGVGIAIGGAIYSSLGGAKD